MKPNNHHTPLFDVIWPRLDIVTPSEVSGIQENIRRLEERIRSLKSCSAEEMALLLDEARNIRNYESTRRLNAEARATTIIATVATLFTFMTWALSNAAKDVICSPGLGCGLWSIIFSTAIVYFIAAALASLQVLTVGTYQVIGIEDLVAYRENDNNLHKSLIQDTLLTSLRNRSVINLKIAHIKIAQRRFLFGLIILGMMLIWDPFARLEVTKSIKESLLKTLASQSRVSKVL